MNIPGEGVAVMVDGGQVSNSGEFSILTQEPYIITLGIRGTSAILLHRYQTEDVEAKAKAGKNSAAKKTDNVEAYVYRDEEEHIGLPGTYIYACLQDAGRYMQDPRSPRKSARDLIKAGIVPITDLAPFMRDGEYVTKWDYVDQRRVTINRAAVTRSRPAMTTGWTCEWQLLVNAPEWLSPETVLTLANNAGRLCGIADFRPTYGRFAVSRFLIEKALDN
jgi:hypothetical protein